MKDNVQKQKNLANNPANITIEPDNNNNQKFIVSYFDRNAKNSVKNEICRLLIKENIRDRDLVIFCIGTDRVIGDSLGPFIGSKLMRSTTLKSLSKQKNIKIYGTLHDPIHAINLDDKLANLDSKLNDPIIVAVDACISARNEYGSVIVENKPLEPGSGVGKKLTPVGTICIKPIVLKSKALKGSFLLNNVRISQIVDLSNFVAKCIISGVKSALT